MFELVPNITFIHNSSGNISNDFFIPSTSGSLLSAAEFNSMCDTGNDVFVNFPFVNEVKMKRTFKDQKATCTITFPKNMNFDGLNLTRQVAGTNNLISRNDRVVVQLGYSKESGGNGPSTQFCGYVSKINFGAPLVIECEDLMFGLKAINCNIKPGKFTLLSLITQILVNNPSMTPDQDNYFITQNTSDLNTQTTQLGNNNIPVYIPLNTPTFTYGTTTVQKTAAEVLADIKKLFGVYIYFDDYMNLHVELPFYNSQNVLKNNNFLFENMIIDDKNLKWQSSDNIFVKVIYKSKNSDSSKPTIISNSQACVAGQSLTFNNVDGLSTSVTELVPFNLSNTTGFVGDINGEQIEINGPNDLTQVDCDYWALKSLLANKYTGYAQGSHFEAFFQPSVYVGQQVTIKSIIYPEKNGTFLCSGTEKVWGMDGGRQKIEIGPVLPSTTNLNNFIISAQLLKLIQQP